MGSGNAPSAVPERRLRVGVHPLRGEGNGAGLEHAAHLEELEHRVAGQEVGGHPRGLEQQVRRERADVGPVDRPHLQRADQRKRAHGLPERVPRQAELRGQIRLPPSVCVTEEAIDRIRGLVAQSAAPCQTRASTVRDEMLSSSDFRTALPGAPARIAWNAASASTSSLDVGACREHAVQLVEVELHTRLKPGAEAEYDARCLDQRELGVRLLDHGLVVGRAHDRDAVCSREVGEQRCGGACVGLVEARGRLVRE